MAAAAAGKKSTFSLSLFVEAYGLKVEEETFYLGHSVTGQKEFGREKWRHEHAPWNEVAKK